MKVLKRICQMTLLFSVILLLGACGKDENKELVALFTENIEKNDVAPWTEKEEKRIIESRGQVIKEIPGEEEGEVEQIKNSFSPGQPLVFQLGAMSEEQLKALDPIAQINIFINGVIRKEYTVAAHTLYGKENVERYRQEFYDGMLRMAAIPNADPARENTVLATTYVDRIGLVTALKDPNVARFHARKVIESLERVYFDASLASDFGTRVTASAQVYPLNLPLKLEQLRDEAYQFVGIDPEEVESIQNLEDEAYEGYREALNQYYVESFGGALANTNVGLEENEAFEGLIGGFELQKDGTWVPADFGQLSWNLIVIAYGLDTAQLK